METTKIIKVANGLVEGRVKSILGRDIVQFLSIPYCKAPVGELRFQRPHPCDSFSDRVINKLYFETFQPQSFLPFPSDSFLSKIFEPPQGKEDEDSLYVNIWCPLDFLCGDKKQPVLIYIHGGGFVCGASSTETCDGSILSSQENIIVATFNYRIGFAGFLCLDNFIKGNMGIWDQVQAIKWIYDNISAFNGDRDNMTLGGCSSGGVSVSLHLLIQESWPHFSKAIVQSGVCLADWSCLPKEELNRRSIICVNKILEKYKFPINWGSELNDEERKSIIEYLQTLNLKTCMNDIEGLFCGLQLIWAPCIDGDLIKDRPQNLFNIGKFKICPTILQNTENEGSMIILMQSLTVDDGNQIPIKYFDKGLEFYPHFPIPCKASTLERIKSKYQICGEVISTDLFERYIADITFICPTMELAETMSKWNDHVYYLWYNTPFESIDVPKCLGVFHGSDVNPFFGNYLKPKFNSSDSDKEFCKHLMGQFCSFMKNGTLLNNLPCYDTKSKKYISIEKEGWIVKVFTDDLCAKVAFWKNLRATFD